VDTGYYPHQTPPDKVYKLKGLDTKAIKAEMAVIEKQVRSGQIKYQLLPNIRLFSGMQNILNHTKPNTLAQMVEDPISGLPNSHLVDSLADAPRLKLSVYNCTLLTEHLLQKGGMRFPKRNFFRAPWEITPTSLAEIIKSDSRAEEVDFSAYEKQKNNRR
jgi:hypothetical protein